MAKFTKQKFTEMLGFLRWYAQEESSGRLGKAADMLEWARDRLFADNENLDAVEELPKETMPRELIRQK